MLYKYNTPDSLVCKNTRARVCMLARTCDDTRFSNAGLIHTSGVGVVAVLSVSLAVVLVERGVWDIGGVRKIPDCRER